MRRPFLFTISLVLVLLVGCGLVRSRFDPKALRIIENVPFYPQEPYQCGPASLAGVLNFWGISVSPDEIAGEIYSRTAGGTLTIDLVTYASRRSMKASSYKGSFADLKARIDSNLPLIVLVDEGIWGVQRNHFMVVLGYGEDGVVVNSGKERHKFISLKKFLASWEKTKSWTLLVTPSP